MSLKTAFAAVLKAMRASRGVSQKTLAEVSSRTYISKLERGQSSPTLEMVTALSPPIGVSPLTLVALTLGAESGQSTMSIVKRGESELMSLANTGVLQDLRIPLDSSRPLRQKPLSRTVDQSSSTQQVEFCFAN
jgi:transcriptional regulator with XRE-family HTH domain